MICNNCGENYKVLYTKVLCVDCYIEELEGKVGSQRNIYQWKQRAIDLEFKLRGMPGPDCPGEDYPGQSLGVWRKRMFKEEARKKQQNIDTAYQPSQQRVGGLGLWPC